MLRLSFVVAIFVGCSCSIVLANTAVSNADLFAQRFAWKGDDKGKGNYYYGGNGYDNYGGNGGGYNGGSYGGGGYGNNGYYGMSYYKDKDDEWKLCEIAIPLALLLLVPLILVGGPFLILGLVFYVGRSNSETSTGIIPGIDVIQGVHEAVEAFRALSTDETCRMKVACELGYIFKGSKSKNKLIRFFDFFLPVSMAEIIQPLKKAADYGEHEGRCERYNCPATNLVNFGHNNATKGDDNSSGHRKD
ncbi:hypothetical protein CHUAL_007746 [Chamberlinius hualienensis]